jgi:hypothetical protein
MNLTGAQLKHVLHNISYPAFNVLTSHLSPDTENSIAKGIPMAFLWIVPGINRILPVRVKYRGPRLTAPGNTRDWFACKNSCLKKDATSFAIYPR